MPYRNSATKPLSTKIATGEQSRDEASDPLGATLYAYPTDADTQDRNSIACQFARDLL